VVAGLAAFGLRWLWSHRTAQLGGDEEGVYRAIVSYESARSQKNWSGVDSFLVYVDRMNPPEEVLEGWRVDTPRIHQGTDCVSGTWIEGLRWTPLSRPKKCLP
jgi:hypothetical protein